MKPEDYKGNGAEFVPMGHVGFCQIRVLEFLTGDEWDDISLALVQALRPTRLRVITNPDMVQLSWPLWGVTVYLSNDNRIMSISQHVKVGLPAGYANGHAIADQFVCGSVR